jgi:ElaB/YqjD/DUF883 family membrane-anchored ribosome-binding protein
MENEEIIRQQMEATRESLTNKLEILEGKLLGSVERATTAVNDTVEQVKETVSGGVESVKDAFDIAGHIDKHPWFAVGTSVFCGYLVGSMAGEPSRGGSSGVVSGSDGWAPSPQASAPSRSWLSSLEPEIRHLKGLAIGSALGVLRDWASGQLPPQLAHGVGEIIDEVTRKIGGEPMRS